MPVWLPGRDYCWRHNGNFYGTDLRAHKIQMLLHDHCVRNRCRYCDYGDRCILYFE